MTLQTNLQRVLAIGGGAFAFFIFAGAASYFLDDSPIMAEALSCVPGVGLFYFFGLRAAPGRVTTPAVIPRGFLMATPFLFLAVNWVGKPLSEMPEAPQLVGAIALCLLIGLGEELIFRSYLQRLCHQWSLGAAVVVPSVIFGLFHFEQGWAGICVTLVVGLSFGLARASGVPLLALIVVHALIDLPQQLPHSMTPFYDTAALTALSYTSLVAIAFMAIPMHWSRCSRNEESDYAID